MKRFVVTGCARSGTMYGSLVLSAAGVPCTHEKAFHVGGVDPGWPMPPFGDSSWLAAAYLGVMPRNTLVVHQVRSPLPWLRSYLRKIGTKSRWTDHAAHLSPRLSRAIDPSQFGTPQMLRDLMLVYTEWNTMAERTGTRLRYIRYGIEDFGEKELKAVLSAIDGPPDADVAKALSDVSRFTNTVGDKTYDGLISWDTLPRGPERDAFEHTGIRYGYEGAR